MLEWTGECMNAFQKLKDILASEIVMAYPKESCILIWDTEALDTGMRATLSQKQYCDRSETEKERPIAHASKSLTKTQRQ